MAEGNGGRHRAAKGSGKQWKTVEGISGRRQWKAGRTKKGDRGRRNRLRLKTNSYNWKARKLAKLIYALHSY